MELVEHVELEFQPDADLVGDALGLQRGDRLPDDVAQVLVEVRLGADVEDVAKEIEHPGIGLDRIEEGETEVRLDEHVGAVHGGEPQARGVDADALGYGLFGEVHGRHRDVAKPPVDVRNVEGNELDSLLRDELLHLGYVLEAQHVGFLRFGSLL